MGEFLPTQRTVRDRFVTLGRQGAVGNPLSQELDLGVGRSLDMVLEEQVGRRHLTANDALQQWTVVRLSRHYCGP